MIDAPSTVYAPDAVVVIRDALLELRTALRTLDRIDDLPRHRRYWAMWHAAQAEAILAEYLEDQA